MGQTNLAVCVVVKETVDPGAGQSAMTTSLSVCPVQIVMIMIILALTPG